MEYDEELFNSNVKEIEIKLPECDLAKFYYKLLKNLSQISNDNMETNEKNIIYKIYSYTINHYLYKQVYEDSEHIFEKFFIVEEIFLCLSIVFFNFLKENKQIFESFTSYSNDFTMQFILESNKMFNNRNILKNYFNT